MAVKSDKERGVQNRGVPTAPAWATEPPVWGEPITFQHLRERFEEMDRKTVYRFAHPDGSRSETNWQSESAAKAWANINGLRYLGEVPAERPAERTPRDLGSRGTEPSLSPPPLVQAEPPLSPPPLVQTEPPFAPLPWPKGNRPDEDQRGTKNKLAGSGFKAKAPSRVHIETWTARLLDPPDEDVIAADPKDAGDFANPDIPREMREKLLGAAFPFFGRWLMFELTPTVSNFLINLHTKLNDVSELTSAGIIPPGKSTTDRGTLLENGSQRNAFRHTFGQALISREYGRKLAVASGFAHEDLPTIDTTRRYFFITSGAPSYALFEVDTVADQLNNEIGRRIAERLGPTVSNIDLATAVLNEFKDKGLYVATFEMKGVVKLSRVRLTQKEFNQFTTLLSSLKENGRAK